MLKKSVSAVAICALITATTPSLAAPELIPGPGTMASGLQQKAPRLTAGAYLRVPFTGGLKRQHQSEARFGLALSGNFSGRYQPGTLGSSYTPRMLDLSAGIGGNQSLGQSLQINSMPLYGTTMLYADEDAEGEGEGKKKKKSNTVLWVLGGMILGAGLLIGITYAAVCADDEWSC